MCSCSKCHKHAADICLYVPFGIIFVLLGIVQIISGIWYLLPLSVVKLILHIAIGCWAILSGISGAMVACVCPSTPRKHEFLLYCSLSVLILNIVNVVSLEFGQTKALFEQLSKENADPSEFLESDNGHYCTTFTALISIIVAFVESQITFCFLNRSQIVHRKEKCQRKNHRAQYIDDVNADEEYIIHRNDKKNEPNGSRKVSLDTTVQVYAKSWVFEGTGEDGYHQPDDSLSGSLCSSASPTHSNAIVNGNSPLPQPKQQHQQQPPPKHNKTRRISKASDATSERFNQPMSSFSRCATPSPIPHSGQATPTNMYSDFLDVSSSIGNNQNHIHHQQTQKSNRLTIDYVPSPHSVAAIETVAVTVPIKHTSKIIIQSSNGPPSISSQQDDSQYASMLAELEQSLIDKKIQPNAISPDDTSISTDKYGSSKSSSKDLEFSKELEAALQLIQELETPSEGPLDTSANQTKFARSESEKTLSAAVSLPTPESAPPIPKSSSEFQTPLNGKHSNRNIIHIEPSSQSTSGYSSPNSFTSNAPQLSTSSLSQASHRDHIISADQSNVVRIYIEPSNGQCNTTINGNTNLLTKGHILNASNLIETAADAHKMQPNDSLNKSFLLFKKRSKLMPQPDFQNRIFKSECLAYLTDEELVARHRCNRDVIRKIEQTVAQKIRGSPRYDESRT